MSSEHRPDGPRFGTITTSLFDAADVAGLMLPLTCGHTGHRSTLLRGRAWCGTCRATTPVVDLASRMEAAVLEEWSPGATEPR